MGESLLVFSVQFSGKREKVCWFSVFGFQGRERKFSVFSFQERKEEMKTGWLGFFWTAGVDASDEALKHGGNFAGFFDHFAGVFDGLLLESFLDAFADVELGPEFAAGAFADAKETDEVTFAVALGSFGDV